MNKLIIAAVIGFVVGQTVLAASPSQKGPSPARLKAFYARIAREGGYVVKPAVGKKVLFVNAQNLAADKAIEDAVGLISSKTRLLTEQTNGDPARQYCPDEKNGAVITIISKPGEPTLLVAPENGWAIVNIEPLKAGNPDVNTFESRVIKEIWRGFAMVMGASNSPFQPCLMRQVTKPADLDSNPMVTPSPMLYNNIREASRSLGIGEFVRETYLSACQHGWAPTPTNDVQKAIWAEVHKIPDKPIKIEYDPKKGK